MYFIIGMKNAVIFSCLQYLSSIFYMLEKEGTVILSCLNHVWDVIGQ